MVERTGLRTLTVILSSECNLRCAYCFQNAKGPGRMSWSVLRPALDLLLASDRPKTSLVFTGGEPTLEFSSIRRATEYIERHAPPRMRIGFYLTTNGTRVDRRRTRYLAEHGFHVQLSLDGTPTAQDYRGRGTWRALDALLTRLQRDHRRWFHSRVSVALTLHPATLPYLADSLAYLVAKDVREIGIAAASRLPRAWHSDALSEVEVHLARAARVCRSHFERTGRAPVDLFLRRPARAPSDDLCGVGDPCYVAVDVNGEVSPCSALARSYQRFPDTRLGRSLTALRRGAMPGSGLAEDMAESAAELRRTGLTSNRRDKFSSYGRCAECRYADECSICPISLALEPGNDNANRIPDFECAFNRVAARLRRRFPAAS